MFLLFLAGSFFWLILRDFRSEHPTSKDSVSFNRVYRITLLVLGLVCLWFPFDQWRFNQFLSEKATLLAGGEAVDIHCDSAIDAIFEAGVGRAGTAYIEDRQIIFHHSWCGKLKDYLDQPSGELTRRQQFSLHLFTHEVMHIRGERDEQKTDCQAVQRDYQAARLLGVPEGPAKDIALHYYRSEYPKHPYYSARCHPGGPLDEVLVNSTWQFL